MTAVVVLYNTAHADVGAYLQGATHGDGAVTAPAPVVILHGATVHVEDTITSLDHATGIAHAVLEGSHQGDCLKHRARLHKVGHGVIPALGIAAVGTPLQINDGLDVASLNLHHYSHAHVAINVLTLEFSQQGTLSQVLHVDIYRGNDVGTVSGRRVSNVEVLVEHLATVYNAVLATQQGIVELFQSVLGLVLAGIEVAHGTVVAKGMLARVKLLAVEAAGIAAETEHRQRLDLAVGIVVYTAVVDGPATALLAAPLFQVALVLSRCTPRKHGAEPGADRVYLDPPQRVGSGVVYGLEVYKQLILRERTGQDSAVAAQNIAPHSRHSHTVLLDTAGHLHPVGTLNCHNVGRLSYHYHGH